MGSRALLAPALVAALAVAAFAGSAAAFSSPTLDASVGRTLGAHGEPNDGGVSVMFSPMWSAGNRTRFGVATFVDDIGTTQKPFVDAAGGALIGSVADRHRMTWGFAWRADHDVLLRRRWSVGVSALTGWWRVVDDLRGTPLEAASAVGLGVGIDARRKLAARHEIGIATRWQTMTSDPHAAFQRVHHYATAALEWRWTVSARQ